MRGSVPPCPRSHLSTGFSCFFLLYLVIFFSFYNLDPPLATLSFISKVSHVSTFIHLTLDSFLLDDSARIQLWFGTPLAPVICSLLGLQAGLQCPWTVSPPGRGASTCTLPGISSIPYPYPNTPPPPPLSPTLHPSPLISAHLTAFPPPPPQPVPNTH